MISKISQVVKNLTIMTTKKVSNNIQVVIATNPSYIKISGIARNYVKWHRSYYWGTNPYYEDTVSVFQMGELWFIRTYGGNYTSRWNDLSEVSAESAAKQIEKLREGFVATGEDDGQNTYSLVEDEKKEMTIELPIKGVSVANGPIAKAISAEKQWRREHMICEESVVEQVLEQVGRYEFVEDAPKGLHNSIVKAADGKVYSVDVSKRAGMGYWIYDAVVKEFSPEAEVAARKAFGRKVRALSLTSGVPFDVVKMLGESGMADPKVGEMLHLLRLVHDLPKSEDERHELSCGIDRRKAELQRLLPEEVYNFFGVDYLGQGRCWSLAGYVAGC